MPAANYLPDVLETTAAERLATVAQPVMGFKRGRRLFTREIAQLLRP